MDIRTLRPLTTAKAGLGAVLITFILFLWWVLVINTATGGPTIVSGTITERCIPQGKQSNIFLCTTKLNDGSTQLFRTLRPLELGTPVSFRRYSRRFGGVLYEIESF